MTKYVFIIKIVQILLAWWETSSDDKIITDDEIADVLTKIAKETNYRIKIK